MPRLSWRNLGAVAVVMVVIGLLIASAGGRSEPDSSENVALGYVPLVTPTPIPRTVRIPDLPQPGGGSNNSALVMVQGLVERRLVIWPVSGVKPPLAVDHHVAVWLLMPDPTRSRVLYHTDRAMMVLDLDVQRAHIVGELPPESTIIAAQWSPDGRAVAYVVESGNNWIAYTTLANGSQAAAEMLRVPRGLPLDVAWLADGRPVAIYMGVGPVGGLEAQYWLYDPATGEGLPLSPEVETFQPWSPWRSPDGRHQVYPMASWGRVRYGEACIEGALGLVGSEWLYLTSLGARGTPRAVAFAIDNMYLDRPTWLSDGRVVFRGVADRACKAAGSGLFVARLGGEPRRIVTIEPVFDSGDPDELLWSVPYAVSPDQQSVAWVKNDVQAGRSTVFLSPIDGEAPAQTLFETGPITSREPFAFHDQEMILQLLWLP